MRRACNQPAQIIEYSQKADEDSQCLLEVMIDIPHPEQEQSRQSSQNKESSGKHQSHGKRVRFTNTVAETTRLEYSCIMCARKANDRITATKE